MNPSGPPAPSAREPGALFGAVAVRLGYSTEERIKESLVLQARMKELGIAARQLGEILAARGHLTQEQRDAIYAHQCRQAGIPAVPGYRILSLLGKGAFGAVYKAVQTSLERVVAIKGLAPEYARSPGFRARLQNEARLVARLNHPHLVQGIDVVDSPEGLFLVMEYIDGPSVRRLIQERGRLGPRLALGIVAQVAGALHHAHALGIIHRDIKPENIMLTRKGIAKLCDLGVAKLAGAAPESSASGAPRLVGTPFYLSPEQARGETALDARSDIYSLGAAFYHMVTGRVPFEGATSAEVISKHLTEAPPPPRHWVPELQAEIDQALLRMLAKDPRDRFQSASDLYRELRNLREKCLPAAPVAAAAGNHRGPQRGPSQRRSGQPPGRRSGPPAGPG